MISESVAYVGMDVDQNKIAVALLAGYEGEPREQRVVANRGEQIEEFFTCQLERFETVMACYEAGSCGFELHRRLEALGVACMVAAPASVPQKAGRRVKTDRRDARTLAKSLRNGELSAVLVPSREDEATRDYLRLYEDIKSDLKKAKQRILHFLHRHEIRYWGGTKWTGKFWRWLRTVRLSSALAQETLEEYVSHAAALEERRRAMAQRVEEIAGEERYEQPVRRLRSFKGIATLTALSLVVEIVDFRRFAHAEQFMAFLGLVPSEYSSGGRRKVGSITKAGNAHLRKLLVEAAWHARSYHASAKRLKQARECVPAEVRTYADRAGRRLTKKYWRLMHVGKPPQIAAIAVARELAGFVWGAMVGEMS